MTQRHLLLLVAVTVVVARPVNAVDFTWGPVGPQVGERVDFTISDNPGRALDKAQWAFGGEDCLGNPPDVTCIPDQYFSCMRYSRVYDTAGTKTVDLLVTVDGHDQPLVRKTVTVRDQGGCRGGGGGGGGGSGGGLNPRITWVPSSPEIGQTVFFRISVEGMDSVDFSWWNFGSVGCDGAGNPVECESGPDNDCLTMTHRYPESGLKFLSIFIKADDKSGGDQAGLWVQEAGSCDVDASIVFLDAFESGNTSAWSEFVE